VLIQQLLLASEEFHDILHAEVSCQAYSCVTLHKEEEQMKKNSECTGISFSSIDSSSSSSKMHDMLWQRPVRQAAGCSQE